MASSSTSSIPKSFKYDVFLSFRGEDTRKSFVDHLYHALEGENIETYKDDEKMVKGERICDELINAIEDSRFYIIVFSKSYASSSWCLDELVKIMECLQGTTEQKAYPVFYDVEPTEVRKQSGAVAEAFARRRMDEDAGRWRKALEEAAGLAGFGLKNTANGHEAQFIQEIVKVISHELNSISFMVDEKLVGMETRIKGIISSLELGFVDVRMLGIKGMGGGGKTTLARAVFDQISHQFEGKSFVENVREVSKSSLSGLKSLQEKILSNVLGKQIDVNDVHEGKKMMKRKLCGRKVLVVLDDVDLLEQLETLAGEPNWFKSGSRIIITTRDGQVLRAHEVTSIHDVNLLSKEEAICLFNRFAFRIGEVPSPRFKKLSQQVVRYAAGLPLTIRVLGSNLKGKDEDEWKDTLESLKKIPLEETLQKLELSFMDLQRDHKDIFLDVACFWKGEEKDDAIRGLESCQLHAKAGLSVLEKKSLITVSKYGSLEMHDSIQEMGWDIVRRDHRDEPERCSRLWDAKEIENILANDLGSEATRGIKLWSSELNPSIIMKGLKNMKKLRFLHVKNMKKLQFLRGGLRMDYSDGSHRDRKNDEASQYLPNALQYLYWGGYPFSSLPKTFQASNLVGLRMYNSNLVKLWEGGERKILPKLRFFEISHDSRLKTLDLGLTPDLETLRITYCDSVKKLHMSAKCLKLKSLDITGSKLTTLDLEGTPNLETLRLSHCSDLVELQNIATCLKLKSIDIDQLHKLKTLNLERTPNLETNLEGAQNLETLRLDLCSDLVEVQMPAKCRNLKFLHINGSKLTTLHLEGASNLETLILQQCYNLVELKMPSEYLKLKSFGIATHNIRGFSNIKSFDLGKAPILETLSLKQYFGLEEDDVEEYCDLEEIDDLSCSNWSTIDLQRTLNLKKLVIRLCGNGSKSNHDNLLKLHMPIGLPKLESLELGHPMLRSLDLVGTPNPEGCDELDMALGCPNLQSLKLFCSKLSTLDLGLTPNLKEVDLGRCNDLVEVRMPVRYPILKTLNLSHSKLRTLDIAMIPNLEILVLEGVKDLELERPLECPKLKTLNLSCSKLKTLELRTPNLEILCLQDCSDLVVLHMFDECPKLTYLSLRHSKLRTFNVMQTPNLSTLDLEGCYNLVKLDAPIGCLKKITKLNLSGCVRFENFDFCKKFAFSQVSVSSELKLIVKSIDICPLHPDDNNSPKFRFECYYAESGSSLIGNLEKLISEGLCACTKLEGFYESICDLRNLRKLELIGNIPEVPKDLGRLGSLEELKLSSTEIKHLPDSICMLQRLKFLTLDSCHLLEKLPEDLGRLGCLEELMLSSTKIKHLPDSICVLQRLKFLELESCHLLEKLPEDLGRLGCLEELMLSSTKIKHLPDSICVLQRLKFLELKSCHLLEKLPEDLGRLGCLEELMLSSTKIKHLPDSICMLQRLKILKLESCHLLEKLPEDLGAKVVIYRD